MQPFAAREWKTIQTHSRQTAAGRQHLEMRGFPWTKDVGW